MLTLEQLWEVVAYDAFARQPALNGGRSSRHARRYNYIRPAPPTDGSPLPDAEVWQVAVRIRKDGTPCAKAVARFSPAKGRIMARDLYATFCMGWKVLWDEADERAAANRHGFVRAEGVYDWEDIAVGRGCGFMDAPDVNADALDGTRYRWCMWTKDNPWGIADWLTLYRAEPKVELLAKMGLWRLCTKACADELRGAKARAYLLAHADELRRCQTGAREFLWACRRNVPPIDGARHFETVRTIEVCLFSGCRPKRVDYDRVERMLPRWHATAVEYGRYLMFAKKCGLDLECEGVAYPPPDRPGRETFRERLERLEEEDAARVREEIALRKKDEARRRAAEAARVRETVKELERLDAALAASGEAYAGDGVTCSVATSRAQLRDEGRKMRNCVGNGRYWDETSRGESFILLFRRNGRPFVDAEVDRRTFRVRQCYAKGNSPAPDEVADAARRAAAFLRRACRHGGRAHAPQGEVA